MEPEVRRSRQSLIPDELRREILSKYQSRCQSCGTTENVELAAVVPLREGGPISADNLLVLCPSCHYAYDSFQPREVEFINFLHQLLIQNPNYDSPVVEKLLDKTNRSRADLFVHRISKTAKQSLLIECKNRGFFRGRQLEDVINQIDRYRSLSKPDFAALAFPGRLNASDKLKLEQADIELWDIDYIASHFREEIQNCGHPGFKTIFAPFFGRLEQQPESSLMARLASCKPGKDDWSSYQRLIRDVFEVLFVPPLDASIWELADDSEVNRRDLIYPNYADQGFWKFLREAYQADYIVLDAKNYKNKISKAQVLQVAHYLKPHGAGMFAIIASRSGGDYGAKVTQREQWAMHQKLILILNDKDVEAMLIAATSRGQPEKVLGQIIQEFRLSM